MLRQRFTKVERRRPIAARTLVAAALAALCVLGAPVAAPSAGATELPSLTPSQFKCIAEQPLEGLANDRPPTIEEIVRVLNAARNCGFQPPRGYAEQYYESTTGLPAPHVAPPASELPQLTAAQVKCLADQHLTGLANDRAPTAAEILRVIAAAKTCGVAVPAGYLELLTALIAAAGNPPVIAPSLDADEQAKHACLASKNLSLPEAGAEPTQAQKEAFLVALQSCGFSAPSVHKPAKKAASTSRSTKKSGKKSTKSTSQKKGGSARSNHRQLASKDTEGAA